MKVVLISDTHEKHGQIKLPEGDLLIHCGDWTNKGSLDAMNSFLKWFSAQPFQYKIFIGGNHELGLDVGPTRVKKLDLINSFNNLIYLENSSTIIDGIKIYGSPVTPFFYSWSWNVHRGEPIAQVWKNIPDDTNILITHGPPYAILDLVSLSPGEIRDVHQGCEELIKRVKQLKHLKLHCFGHLHLGGHGSQIHREGGTAFVNAAMVDDGHRVVNQPVVIEL